MKLTSGTKEESGLELSTNTSINLTIEFRTFEIQNRYGTATLNMMVPAPALPDGAFAACALLDLAGVVSADRARGGEA